MAAAHLTRRAFTATAVSAALSPWLARAQPDASPAIRLPSSDIAYLMADQALRDPALIPRTESPTSPKRFWVEHWRDPGQTFAWSVLPPRAGSYEATLMLSAPPGTSFELQGPRNTLRFTTTQPLRGGYAWDRIVPPGSLALPAGPGTLTLRLLGPVPATARAGVAFKSIELLSAAARPAFDARIRTFKSDTSWLNRAKFGLMCQCGEWSYPPHGDRTPWPGFADRFDVQKFAALVGSTGAGYAIWSATWATYFFPAPIRAIDRILPGRTSRRDLIGEIADALAARNIRLLLYYHAGHDRTPANGDWWPHTWVSPTDKTLFFDNWCAIMTEVGERYGDRLAGWLFDDELIYYPAPYERLGAAAKAGSARRLIAYNPWIQPRGTDFQDLQFGEGLRAAPDLAPSANGLWPSGPMRGLHAHGNFQLDGPDWGVNHPDTVIEPPHLTPDLAIQVALDAAQRNLALSWNLLMYEDGSVSPASLAILQQAGRAVRQQYPR